MTSTTTNTTMTTGTNGAFHWFDKFFAGLGQGFNAYLESKSRMKEIQELSAKSDAELAEMGIAREDVPRHVFRDLLFV